MAYKLILLPPQSQQFELATHKVIIKAADVAALGASASATLQIIPGSGTFPAGTTARFAGLNLITAFDFSDAGITSLLIRAGDGNDTDRLLTDTEIAVDGTEVLYKVEGAVTQPYAYPIADSIDVVLTAANGGTPLLSECTVGEVELYFHIRNMNDLERAQ